MDRYISCWRLAKQNTTGWETWITEVHCFTVLVIKNSRSVCQQRWFGGRPIFPDYRWLPFHCVLVIWVHIGAGVVKERSSVFCLLKRAPVLLDQGPTSWFECCCVLSTLLLTVSFSMPICMLPCFRTSWSWTEIFTNYEIKWTFPPWTYGCQISNEEITKTDFGTGSAVIAVILPGHVVQERLALACMSVWRWHLEKQL